MHALNPKTGAELLNELIRTFCGLSAESFESIPKEKLPSPARQILDHTGGMTSTLEAFHRQPLSVEILREKNGDDYYAREIFLRTTRSRSVVAYAVISICMEQFTLAQQDLIRSGRLPFGAQLEYFCIPFSSAPAGFFSVPSETVAQTPLGVLGLKGLFYGRFNQLTKPSGQVLAWTMEIVPPVS